MKQDLNKILNTILLLTISVTLLYLTSILKDLSKNGRFQISSSTDGTEILDTRTGETFTTLPKNVQIDTSMWKFIPYTNPILKEKE